MASDETIWLVHEQDDSFGPRLKMPLKRDQLWLILHAIRTRRQAGIPSKMLLEAGDTIEAFLEQTS